MLFVYHDVSLCKQESQSQFGITYKANVNVIFLSCDRVFSQLVVYYYLYLPKINLKNVWVVYKSKFDVIYSRLFLS